MLKNLLNGGNVIRYIFSEFEKLFRTSVFLSTSEWLLLNIPETRSLHMKAQPGKIVDDNY